MVVCGVWCVVEGVTVMMAGITAVHGGGRGGGDGGGMWSRV